MLGEASRELNYEAGIAGISAGLKVGTKIQFEHWSYNDKVEPYLKELFNFIQNFETDEAFFNNKVDRYKRSLKNSLQAEPY
jgi:secreted Zn-dependent insulinase-like peptidase